MGQIQTARAFDNVQRFVIDPIDNRTVGGLDHDNHQFVLTNFICDQVYPLPHPIALLRRKFNASAR